MTPQELIEGMRERGLFVTRMQVGPTTLVNVMAHDPLAEFLGSTLGCTMTEFRPEAWTKPHLRAYEVRLNTAQVVFTDLDPADPGYARARGMAIWEAAA